MSGGAKCFFVCEHLWPKIQSLCSCRMSTLKSCSSMFISIHFLLCWDPHGDGSWCCHGDIQCKWTKLLSSFDMDGFVGFLPLVPLVCLFIHYFPGHDTSFVILIQSVRIVVLMSPNQISIHQRLRYQGNNVKYILRIVTEVFSRYSLLTPELEKGRRGRVVLESRHHPPALKEAQPPGHDVCLNIFVAYSS